MARAGVEGWETSGGVVRVRRQPCPQGPRLLFAADGPNVLEHYDGLFASLRGRADVVAYEPPGTGGSAPARDFGFRLDDFADNARDVLEKAGPRILVFPCYMSFVAGALARSSDEGVRGLVLPQAPSWAQMSLWLDRVDGRRVLRTPALGQLLVRAMPRRVARGWYAGSASADAKAALADIAEEALQAGGYFCLASLMQNFTTNADRRDDLGDVPSVIAWGDQDRSHGRPSRVTFAEANTVMHFEACGHSPELEDPEGFAEWLLAWCEDAGLSG